MKDIENGLSEALEKIVESHEENMIKYLDREQGLIKYIEFCDSHRFEEEKRIAMVKLQQMSGILRDYKDLVKETRDLLNGWNS